MQRGNRSSRAVRRTGPTSAEDKATLSRDVTTVLAKTKVQDPSLQAFLDKAYGYAVSPTVGKGAVGLGGAYGRGEVFERGRKIGYSDLAQGTIGLALEGQTFTEIMRSRFRPPWRTSRTGDRSSPRRRRRSRSMPAQVRTWSAPTG